MFADITPNTISNTTERSESLERNVLYIRMMIDGLREQVTNIELFMASKSSHTQKRYRPALPIMSVSNLLKIDAELENSSNYNDMVSLENHAFPLSNITPICVCVDHTLTYTHRTECCG